MDIRTFMNTSALVLCASSIVYAQSDRVPAGTEVTVRINDAIDARSPSDSRIYTAVVDRDVTDNSGRVVIRRGSDAELILRDVSRDTVVLDLESVTVDGRRYTVSTSPKPLPLTLRRKRKALVQISEPASMWAVARLLEALSGRLQAAGKVQLSELPQVPAPARLVRR